METKHALRRRSPSRTAMLVAAIGGLCANAAGWTISGMVKSPTGAVLSGVSIAVKDSARYATSTDGGGLFKLESATLGVPTTTGRDNYRAEVIDGELRVRCPRDQELELSLVDGSGRSIWEARPVSHQGWARAPVPKTAKGAVFLRIRHQGGVEYQAVGRGPRGLNLPGSKPAARTMAAFPTLVFKMPGWRDTTYAMNANTVSGAMVTMSENSTVCPLPAKMQWLSSAPLVSPKSDANHPIVAVKDPTIQRYGNQWLVYATTSSTGGTTNGWNMEFLSFADFAQAPKATPTYMDQTPGFGGYKCAPELFFFEPQKRWYFIFQAGPTYATSKTPENPKSWSAPKPLFGFAPGQKSIDFFPICDSKNCFLFFTGDDGYLYKKSTTLANFPNGWTTQVDTVLRYPNNRTVLFEAGSHYKLKGLGKYLTVIEGFGTKGRAFSSWIADTLGGPWKELHASPANYFASSQNVSYPPGVADWTDDVSHGELLRENPDQTQTVDPCNLRFFYQGHAPGYTGDYAHIPYQLGLLTAQ